MGRRRGVVGVAAVLASVAMLLGASLLASAAVVPLVRPGQHVVVRESGFAPRATVTVALVGSSILGTTGADRRGRVAYRFTVPRHIGSGAHALIFAGRAPGGAPDPIPRTTAASGADLQPVRVSAPLARLWRFRTPGPPTHPPSPHPRTSGHSDDHGALGDGSNRGHPSETGVDVLAGLALAAAAIVLGAAVLLAARRR